MNTKHPTGASRQDAPAATYFAASSNLENIIVKPSILPVNTAMQKQVIPVRWSLKAFSLSGIDFINLASQNLIMKNDLLDVSFHLDDSNKTFIQRKAKVTASDKNMINAIFIKFQPYDKDLGFYLMP